MHFEYRLFFRISQFTGFNLFDQLLIEEEWISAKKSYNIIVCPVFIVVDHFTVAQHVDECFHFCLKAIIMHFEKKERKYGQFHELSFFFFFSPYFSNDDERCIHSVSSRKVEKVFFG